MPHQTFGWTAPTAPLGSVTPFVQLFDDESGLVTLVVRGSTGVCSGINLPREAALALAEALKV